MDPTPNPSFSASEIFAAHHVFQMTIFIFVGSLIPHFFRTPPSFQDLPPVVAAAPSNNSLIHPFQKWYPGTCLETDVVVGFYSSASP